MNILDLAKSQLNAESLPGLSELIGIDSSSLPQLITEAIPTILTILKEGAGDATKSNLVEEFLTKIDDSILEDPAEVLVQYGPDLMRSGKSSLAKLLGPKLTDYIAPLAKSTGLGEGKIASTLGALTPFVTALVATKTKTASELTALIDGDELAVATPESKAPTKDTAPSKSYLPDPAKKREKRPFPKRKAILLVLILALVAALLFWLVDTGVIPLPSSTPDPSQTLPEPAPTIETTAPAESSS